MTATGYQFRGRRRRSGAPPSSATSVAKRCNRPISIGFRPSCRSTHAPSHSISTGQTRAQVPPSRFSAKIVAAAASGSSRAIAATKPGTSTPAGHAVTHGASAYGPPHSRHRSASTIASGLVNGETSSSKTLLRMWSDCCHYHESGRRPPGSHRGAYGRVSVERRNICSGAADLIEDFPLPGEKRPGDPRVALEQWPPIVERGEKRPMERLVDESVDDPLHLVPLEDEHDLICGRDRRCAAPARFRRDRMADRARSARLRAARRRSSGERRLQSVP